MRIPRTSAAIQVAVAAMLALLLANCRNAGLEDRLERLPTLPPDLASTLDPTTHATRIPASQPVPVREPSRSGALLRE